MFDDDQSRDNEYFTRAILCGLVNDWMLKGRAWPEYTLDHPLILGNSQLNAQRILENR